MLQRYMGPGGSLNALRLVLLFLWLILNYLHRIKHSSNVHWSLIGRIGRFGLIRLIGQLDRCVGDLLQLTYVVARLSNDPTDQV